MSDEDFEEQVRQLFLDAARGVSSALGRPNAAWAAPTGVGVLEVAQVAVAAGLAVALGLTVAGLRLAWELGEGRRIAERLSVQFLEREP